jgi:2-polyprenyl-6-methoxyphenol hydroxylase-like FAD-dependent oxidoreductase
LTASNRAEIFMAIDVLVVGAGPVGLAMAAELARFGLSVRIVEKAAARTDKSKALVVWSRTLELLDRAGCGQPLVDAGMKVTAANIFAGEKLIAHIRLDGVESPHPYGLMLPQCETERLLEEHLNGLGVKVERNVEMIRFSQTADRISATLRRVDSAEQRVDSADPGDGETVEAAWLAGCDGAHSTVRHGLGMEFEGDTQPSDWVLGDVHLEGVPNAGEVGVYWHAKGALVLFPITATRYRMIADVGSTQSGVVNPDPTLEEVQALLDERGPGGIHASDPIWLAGFHINERKVKDYRKGRVFLLGDAAHVHSPAGGQGMNTGIQDACNLAWKLALVLRAGCAGEPLLGSYSQERSEVGKKVLREAGITTIVGILRGEFKQGIRNHLAKLLLGLAPVREAAAETLTEMAIGYPHSPLNAGSGGHGGPKPGERAPIRAGEAPVGAGAVPRFALFAEPGAEAEAAMARHKQLLEPAVRPPFAARGMWLVRPDGYCAVATRQGDWATVTQMLDKVKG